MEYALLIALIAATVLFAVGQLGNGINGQLSVVDASLGGEAAAPAAPTTISATFTGTVLAETVSSLYLDIQNYNNISNGAEIDTWASGCLAGGGTIDAVATEGASSVTYTGAVAYSSVISTIRSLSGGSASPSWTTLSNIDSLTLSCV